MPFMMRIYSLTDNSNYAAYINLYEYTQFGRLSVMQSNGQVDMYVARVQ